MGKGFLKVQLYEGDYTLHGGDTTTVFIKSGGNYYTRYKPTKTAQQAQ